MKLDQIAYYAHDEEQVEQIKAHMGLQASDWVHDIATGKVWLPDQDGVATGHLRFNYDLGIELEILTYVSGPHWHMDKVDFFLRKPFVSHIGFHMEEGERPPQRVVTEGKIVQVMDTTSHTNEYVVSRQRTYHYEIYSMPFGPDLKYIWRVEP